MLRTPPRPLRSICKTRPHPDPPRLLKGSCRRTVMSPTIWVIAGVVLLVAELAHTVFIMCWLAAGAFVVAVAAGLGLGSLEGQLILFGAVSVALVLASRTVLKPLLPHARGAPTNVDAIK